MPTPTPVSLVKSGDYSNIYFVELFTGLNELIFSKCLKFCVPECIVTVMYIFVKLLKSFEISYSCNQYSQWI